MKIYSIYILHSTSIDQHYIGSTSMPLDSRLSRYNPNHKGFTGKANDWVVIFHVLNQIRNNYYEGNETVVFKQYLLFRYTFSPSNGLNFE